MAAVPLLATVGDFDRLPVAGVVCELDGTVLALNPAAARMFGVTAGVGGKVGDVVPALAVSWDAILDGARERGSACTSLALGARAFDFTATLRDVGREVVFGIAIDVTHHKLAGEAAQARADHASKHRLESLGLVAGGIAHDFNNQLVSVLAEASAAREDG